MAETSRDTDDHGMTVNERLYVSGMLGAFDTAAARGDRSGMLAILGSVKVAPRDAAACVEAVLFRHGRPPRHDPNSRNAQ
jgi:hypothetical protein